ncbi:hypothetical protein U2I54_22165 [Bacillus pseudomycoides]|uniref:Uncharacterized protein n=1 Tax=Bacillus bingmayongensis TaxID=1150157 RepID=A0ABU5K1Y9_9BACI|nr:hypothetical protein [Bacillus pseudomycoides]
MLDISEDLKGEDGYFQIIIDDESYGMYIDHEEVMDFSSSVFWNFSYLLEATILLKEHTVVYLSDIATPRSWIEIKKYDSERLVISEADADKPIGSIAVEVGPLTNVTYPYWKDKVISLEDFKQELLEGSKKYVNDLKQLNGKKHRSILKLEYLIEQVENQYN